jgi:hypothetical protein
MPRKVNLAAHVSFTVRFTSSLSRLCRLSGPLRSSYKVPGSRVLAAAGVIEASGATPAFCGLGRQSLFLAPIVGCGGRSRRTCRLAAAN